MANFIFICAFKTGPGCIYVQRTGRNKSIEVPHACCSTCSSDKHRGTHTQTHRHTDTRCTAVVAVQHVCDALMEQQSANAFSLMLLILSCCNNTINNCTLVQWVVLYSSTLGIPTALCEREGAMRLPSLHPFYNANGSAFGWKALPLQPNVSVWVVGSEHGAGTKFSNKNYFRIQE